VTPISRPPIGSDRQPAALLSRARRAANAPYRRICAARGSGPREAAARSEDQEPSYVLRADVSFNVKRLRCEGKTKLGRADAPAGMVEQTQSKS
jgi:hypothetical protein